MACILTSKRNGQILSLLIATCSETSSFFIIRPTAQRYGGLATLRGQISRYISRPIVLGVVFGTVSGIIGFLVNRQNRRKEEAKHRKIQELAEEADRAEGLIDFVEKKLAETSERENLIMSRATERASKLFWVGILITCFSLAAPFISLHYYLITDQLNISQERVQFLSELKEKLQITLDAHPISLGRDWHILVLGPSIGLIFLAVAAGILRQEARQMDHYFKLGPRITYYRNLVTALKIYERRSKEQDVAVRKHVESFFLEKFAAGPPEAKPPMPEKSSEDGSVPLKELLTSLADIMAKKTS